MQRGTIVLIFFVLAAAGLIGLSTLLRNQPPLTLSLAVDPLIEAWARESVTAFNESNALIGTGRRVSVNVQTVNDIQIWNPTERGGNTFDAWIAATHGSVTYAKSRNFPLQVIRPSIAQTPLMLGGFAERINVLTDNLTWDEIANIAAKDERIPEFNAFLNIAFPLPDRTITGLAVLLNFAADHAQTTQLTNQTLNERGFRERLTPILRSVANFNTITSDAAQYLTRGATAADIVFATESQWLNNLNALVRVQNVQLVYPEYVFMFDFPLVIWQTPETPDEHKQAVEALGNWLMSEAQQHTLKRHGLRPVLGEMTVEDALFIAGEPYGIQLSPNVENRVQMPSNLSDIQSLLRWFQTAIR